MIKIVIDKHDEFNTDFNATATIDDGATTTDAISAFCRILQLAGYGDEGIRSGLESVEYDIYESINASKTIMDSKRDIQ